MTIKDVKVWKNEEKTEVRIYIHTTDGREGCKYLTGNRWHKKGSLEGDLTAEEYAEAKRIAVWDRTWHTVYENQVATRTRFVEDVREDIALNHTGSSFDRGAVAIEETGKI